MAELNPNIILGAVSQPVPQQNLLAQYQAGLQGKQQNALGALALQQARQGAADDQGIRGIDPNAGIEAYQKFGKAGLGVYKQRQDAFKDASDAKDKLAAAQEKAQKTQMELQGHLGNIAHGVQQANYSPDAIKNALDAIGTLDPKKAAYFGQMAQANPPMFKQAVDQLAQTSPKQQELDRQMMTTASAMQQQTEEQPGRLARSQMDQRKNLSMATGQLTTPAQYQQFYDEAGSTDKALLPKPDGTMAPIQALQRGSETQFQREEQRLKGIDQTQRAQQLRLSERRLAQGGATGGGGAAGAGAGGLTSEGLSMAAQNYAKTGVLPALGQKSTAERIAIINEAAKGGQVDLASAKSNYTAAASSLKKLVENKNTVESFEKTAGANLDMFIEQAKKVRDTGSPMLNKPLRALDRNVLGSTDQLAYDTANTVATTEIARVLTNPNLSGVLSDSARAEVAKFNPESATLAQTMRVAQVLRQDMANRKKSITQQVLGIQKTIKTGNYTDTSEETPASTTTAAPAPVPGKKYKKGDNPLGI